MMLFSSFSFYYGLDMCLATRDALVINERSRAFFTSPIVAKEDQLPFYSKTLPIFLVKMFI